MEAGHHRVEIGSRDLPAGILTYSLQAGGFSVTRKMVVIR
jgi:hypothetical protein